MATLILASASPRRKELLQRITTDFQIIPAKGEEKIPEGTPAQEVAVHLAEQKAQEIANQYPDAVVIGCDTTVVAETSQGEVILGKPKDAADAERMLQLLSGATHKVVTGTCVLAKGKKSAFTTVADVTFYPLTDAEIAQYIATGEPMDKAGSYGIQGYGSLLVEKICGDYYTIVGLPIARLARVLQEFQ